MPPRKTPKDGEDFPTPQEQVADPFVEGTEDGEIEEEYGTDLPLEDEIIETDEDGNPL
ncbi:hypothetical protein [Salibacterium aidingense]|uniref:hypothetical protein n=1 Tax=Salibacterium aidingense TaxID=384933 RepID=UPI000413E334|nr:hypothetical protein [Salibacterium aidingense]